MKLTVKRITGYVAAALVAVIVLAFLGLHSLSFFEFTFPDDQSIYAYLGFGLTSGGVVLYLVMLITLAETPLQKFTSIAMLAVSVLGEIITAMFGMRVEAWQSAGFALTQEDFDNMFLAVGILGLLHGIALVSHFAGDAIINAFKDDDGDGTPNLFDKTPKGVTVNAAKAPAVDFDKIELQRRNNEMEKRLADMEKRLAEATQKPSNAPDTSKGNGNPHTGQERKD
jgi:hypothetical protein